VTDRGDGPWDAPTQHDDQHDIDASDMSGEDPPTVRASENQRARARGAAIANQLAHVNVNVVAKAPATTLPPPPLQRHPAKPASQTEPPTTVARTPAPTPAPPPARQQTTGESNAVGFNADSVVVLDRVSGNMPTDHAPRRGEAAAGGIVVVATGTDGDRVRKLCHKHGLLVPVMTSLAVVHDAMSIVVIGEPSPPAPDRVVHVVRPSLPDDMLIDLLRALSAGRVVVEPPQAVDAHQPRVAEAARRLSTLTDRGAIEMTAIEAITALTGADRAHCLFHDPMTGALWSEARRRTGSDDRHAMGGLVGWVAQTGQTIYASPAGDDPRWLQELDDPEGKPQSRVLVQPIIGGDRRVHAVLVAVRRWRHSDFKDAEITALASFAALAGPALDVAVAASPAQPRKRTTMPGVATSASALMSPRPNDSRPPPVTARKAGSSTAQVPMSSKQPAAHLLPIIDEPTKIDAPRTDDPYSPESNGHVADASNESKPKPDERYSADSITNLPAPPPSPPSQPPAPREKRAATAPSDVFDKRTGPIRARSASDGPLPKPRDGEPRELAVIASDDDAKRVHKLAKKLRLELSTFTKLADAPQFYQIVTLGETWSGTDSRVAYAARSTISDDHLGDLLIGLIHDRAVSPAAPLVKPQTAAEARRSQVAFAGARKLAATSDLADAEAIVMSTIQDLLDTDRAYCWFVEPNTGALWSEARKRTIGDDRRAIAGIAGWVARTGRAANVPRASADPRWLGPLDDPEGDPHSQLLVQPLVRVDDRVHGVVIAARRARRPGFTETDAALFARFAALAAPLLEQIDIASYAQQMIGEDTATRPPLPAAPDSPLQAILRGRNPVARWLFLVLGIVVGVILGLLVG
jgi:GAF domain-containing protein